MLKTETRIIDGLDVRVVQHPARRAYSLLKRLGKVVGPALANAQGISLTGDIATLGPALSALFNHLGDNEDLERDLLSCTTVVVEGKLIPLTSDQMIDTVFNGKLESFLKVLWFALEVNFKNFFVSLGAGNVAAALTKPENLSS